MNTQTEILEAEATANLFQIKDLEQLKLDHNRLIEIIVLRHTYQWTLADLAKKYKIGKDRVHQLIGFVTNTLLDKENHNLILSSKNFHKIMNCNIRVVTAHNSNDLNDLLIGRQNGN